MLSLEDNERITRTGPGTPMGEVFRRFWVPALLSSELAEADAPPVRFMLLGERLVAFRDSEGRIGLLEEQCPHRHASLYWGRNEERGLRCVYHGWKFGVDGRCLDMPAEPAGSRMKDGVGAISYETHEAGGIIWVCVHPLHVVQAQHTSASAGGKGRLRRQSRIPRYRRSRASIPTGSKSFEARD